MKRCAILLVLWLTASTGNAQQSRPPQAASLTIQDAVGMAVSSNREIAAAGFDRNAAEFRLLAAKGAYDPRFLIRTLGEKAIIPVGSIIAGGGDGRLSTSQFLTEPALTGLVPSGGGSYEIGFNILRLKTNNEFVTLNPQYASSLSATLIQPLLRGFRFDQTRQAIEVSRQNLSLSKQAFRQTVMDTVTTAVRNYWELAYARSNVDIQREALQLARQQVESNQRAVDEGILAAIAVVEAEVQVAGFEQTLAEAEAGLSRAENQLKRVILGDRASPIWALALAASSPVVPVAVNLDEAEAIRTALANRPELERLRTTLEINKIDNRFFREQTRPALDIVATYGLEGLAGTPILRSPLLSDEILTARVNQLSVDAGLPPLPPSDADLGVVPPLMQGGLGRSLSSIIGWDFPTARVSVVFSFPFSNRTAEGNLGASLAEGRRLQADLAQFELGIEADVRTAITAVISARDRSFAADRQERAARQQYESEQRRFNNGLSTVFLVLVRQTQMVSAQSRALRAKIDHMIAIEDFHRTTGQTLQVHSVVLSP